MVQLGNNLCQHAEFVLEESVGPVLRLTTKEGVALTPIRMTNLDDEDEDGGKEGARKYLASCKSVKYVCVNGRP